MNKVVQKVTAFIVRERDGVKELLVFKHPTAGIQIPAGTVEKDEDIETAVKRETYEETGLQFVEMPAQVFIKLTLKPIVLIVSYHQMYSVRPMCLDHREFQLLHVLFDEMLAFDIRDMDICQLVTHGEFRLLGKYTVSHMSF